MRTEEKHGDQRETTPEYMGTGEGPLLGKLTTAVLAPVAKMTDCLEDLPKEHLRKQETHPVLSYGVCGLK